MSDDDWENAVDEVVESGGKDASTTKDKFKDEDAYDSDQERKKKAELAKAVTTTVEPMREKTKAKDYDALFEARKKKAELHPNLFQII